MTAKTSAVISFFSIQQLVLICFIYAKRCNSYKVNAFCKIAEKTPFQFLRRDESVLFQDQRTAFV